jgi:hypothetical protein
VVASPPSSSPLCTSSNGGLPHRREVFSLSGFRRFIGASAAASRAPRRSNFCLSKQVVQEQVLVAGADNQRCLLRFSPMQTKNRRVCKTIEEKEFFIILLYSSQSSEQITQCPSVTVSAGIRPQRHSHRCCSAPALSGLNRNDFTGAWILERLWRHIRTGLDANIL